MIAEFHAKALAETTGHHPAGHARPAVMSSTLAYSGPGFTLSGDNDYRQFCSSTDSGLYAIYAGDFPGYSDGSNPIPQSLSKKSPRAN